MPGGAERQTLRDFETVVVDSSPTSASERIVRSFPGVKLERSPERLPVHGARNRGAAIAEGGLIVFTDPDCVPRPDWLARLVAAREGAYEIVGGGIEPTRSGWRERGIHRCKFGQWEARGPRGERTTLPTANLLLSRAAWDDVGPFELLGWSGDTELCWRARRAGYRLAFEPAAVVEHHHHPGLRAFGHERQVRGAAFGAMRAEAEGWSRARAALAVGAAPGVPFALLARGGRGAGLATIPVQLWGYAAWALGEASAHVARARGDRG